jgi:hypothetical protein
MSALVLPRVPRIYAALVFTRSANSTGIGQAGVFTLAERGVGGWHWIQLAQSRYRFQDQK